MCGIFFSISRQRPVLPDAETEAALKARGPDSFRTLSLPLKPASTTLPDDEEQVFLNFTSTVLALRGDSIQQQPLIDKPTGSIFCWNGEAWKIAGEGISGSDTRAVFRLLLSAAGDYSDSASSITDALTRVAGPFAFVFFHAPSSTVFYGRDRLGRRSLLVEQVSEDTLTISSIGCGANKHAPTEVTTAGIHHISIRNTTLKPCCTPWSQPLPMISKQVPQSPVESRSSTECVSDVTQKLRQSLRPRVTNIPVHNSHEANLASARLAILFSGGLDCTLLARLIHDIVPHDQSIDLLNVAFENPRAVAASKNTLQAPYELCPDRITGRSSFRELQEVCSSRVWRFVAINVPFAEVLSHKKTIIRLMQPHNTEMDLSIAIALYFAARGQGHANDGTHTSSGLQAYETTARVLISGLGADELFGGYSRHAASFSRGGYEALIEELALDFSRIGQRNLGRDDRVLSNWGREVRYPFLDEDFTKFTLSLPVWEKCGYRPGRKIPKHYEETRRAETEGDLDPAKLLLRRAAWHLGMPGVASERKRAIQFGARTAKMEADGGRKKGTDVLLPD